ncbi:hypothetical protein [Nonomuraea sp. KM90]|uniref:hypothetical protein n=1 Tax=Nonomuraea sp. KM90 TaxID=3457428 RepID=UPI003FCC2DBB
MLSEVEAYFNAVDEAQKTYNIDRERAGAENPRPEWRADMSPEEATAFAEAEDRRTTALGTAQQAYKEKRDQAFQDLTTAENPLVRFIAADPEIGRSYREYAEAVLRALPLSREALEAFGDNQGWGGAYRDVFDRADQAGVLPKPTPDLADIEPLVRELHQWGGGSIVRVRAMVRKHLPDLIASALERQAQQQKQDVQPSA